MTCRSIAAALCAAVLLGAAHRTAPLLAYYAPAGDRPAGADTVHPTTAILPNGRIASPAGASTFVGTNPLGMALTPNGRFLILSNDDARAGAPAQPGSPAAGSSLAVVDAASMKLVSSYSDPSSTFFAGVAVAPDPNERNGAIVLASDGTHGVVRVFELSGDGILHVQGAPIALPSTAGRPAFPAGIALSPDGASAYVADRLGDSVSTIDLAARTVTHTQPVGDFPFAIAAAGGRVLVSGAGLGAYRQISPAVPAPQFAAPPFDPSRSSSLAVFDAPTVADPAMLAMDQAPDGTRIVGGAAPGAIAMRRDGKLAYVALANVDRVAVVSLATSTPRVTRGLDLRLYPDAPYGAQPSAEVLSKDGKRLYVALAGLNAVAVLDARTPTRYRYGLIPTAWYPTALSLSPNGRFLYVAAAKGVGGWGILTRVDLKHTSLVKATMNTLRYNRTAKVAKNDAIVPPLRSGKRSSVVDRVVYIAAGIDAYDAVLGDLKDVAGAPAGNGDATLVQYARDVTPNLHALAQTYALADNFYAPDADVAVSRSIALNADATLYEQLLSRLAPSPGDFGADDPEEYPRQGLLFNAFARAGLSFRDYGGALQLSGYRDGLYHLDVPALSALAGNADAAYAGGDPRVDDAHRAAEFVTDMKRYADASQMPSFTYVWLPTRTNGDGVGDADRALGTIVDFLTHQPQWGSTAIFIVPEGVARGRDHVNALRSYCVVVSPYAKRAYVGRAHLSVPSVVKTEEEIFGLPPLTLNDLLATDMADFFTSTADPAPYAAIR